MVLWHDPGFADIYKKIREITGISERTIERVQALHRCTGDVIQHRIVDGCSWVLNGFEVSVCPLLYLLG